MLCSSAVKTGTPNYRKGALSAKKFFKFNESTGNSVSSSQQDVHAEPSTQGHNATTKSTELTNCVNISPNKKPYRRLLVDNGVVIIAKDDACDV